MKHKHFWIDVHEVNDKLEKLLGIRLRFITAKTTDESIKNDEERWIRSDTHCKAAYLDYVKDEGMLFRVDKFDTLAAQLA